ncbi:hypothetical protein [uncultured Fibrella sp.]|uniref:hypothetical protein n=1 Tax=uncultured Fibrella sp. TaxID=1284596 RepID=UPI0035CB8175
MTTSSLTGQSLKMADLLRLVASAPAAFEQEMVAKGYTCYQQKKSLTTWSCLFMDQRPAYMNQPALASDVMQYVFGQHATVLIQQTKSVADYKAWQSQLISLGFSVDKQPQSSELVGLLYTKDRLSVTLQKVDYYNGISNNQTGYSVSVTWMRQSPTVAHARRHQR